MSWNPGESIFVSSFSSAGGMPATGGGKPLTPDWQKWVAENLLLGNSPQSILDAMLKEGFDRNGAVMEINSAAQHPYLQAARGVKGVPGEKLENKLKKRDWVLECIRKSARMAGKAGEVPRVPRLSRQEFLDHYYAANRPVVIQGAMNDWPAMTQWTPENLKRRLGDRMIEVQANREKDANYELNQNKLKKQMTFGEFVDLTETIGQTNNYYITANNSGQNKAALRELWDDIILFPEYLHSDDPSNRGFFWFGPAGTVTPLHHDLTNNFMAQVRGRKLVKLIAPFELPDLYNGFHCYSPVDLEKIDLERFPQFRNVKVFDVTIGPGDLLFLPIGWWHHVRGLDVSITMTFTNFVFDNDFCSFYSTYNEI